MTKFDFYCRMLPHITLDFTGVPPPLTLRRYNLLIFKVHKAQLHYPDYINDDMKYDVTGRSLNLDCTKQFKSLSLCQFLSKRKKILLQIRKLNMQ